MDLTVDTDGWKDKLTHDRLLIFTLLRTEQRLVDNVWLEQRLVQNVWLSLYDLSVIHQFCVRLFSIDRNSKFKVLKLYLFILESFYDLVYFSG